MTTNLPVRASSEDWQYLRQMLTQWPSVQWIEEVGSTNAELLELARRDRDTASWPRLLGCYHQTRGRGRAGRPWLDHEGQTLMFSCGFMLPIAPRLLAGIAPALGIAACASLRAIAGHQAHRLTMKWPNDIMLDDSKLAGILVESRIQGPHVLLVAGIGLNLSGHSHLSEQLHRHVADWAQLENTTTNRFEIAAAISQSWFECLCGYDENRLLSLREQLRGFDYLLDKPVTILDGNQVQMHAVACGLANDGRLLVKSDDGAVQSVSVGDISVRRT